MDYKTGYENLKRYYKIRLTIAFALLVVVFLGILGVNLWFALISVFVLSFLLWADETNFFIKKMYIEDRIYKIVIWLAILATVIGFIITV